MNNVPLSAVLRCYLSRRDICRLTEKSYEAVLNQFERWLGRPPHTGDFPDRANEYIAFRIEGGNLGASILRGSKMTASAHRAVLALLLRHAAKRGYCRRAKLKPVRRPCVIPRAFTVDEIASLLKHATDIQRAAIMLCFDTGYRRGDLFSAEWGSVSHEGADAIVTKVARKTGRIESRRLRPATIAALLRVQNPDDPRLIPATGTFTKWNKRWKKLGKLAGVDVLKRGLQAIRRAGASYVMKAGGSAQKYLGHRSGDLAAKFYIDPRIVKDLPDLPPPIDGVA